MFLKSERTRHIFVMSLECEQNSSVAVNAMYTFPESLLML